jgi:hypothetical protein
MLIAGALAAPGHAWAGIGTTAWVSILDNSDALAASASEGNYAAEQNPPAVAGAFTLLAPGTITNEVPGLTGSLGAVNLNFVFFALNPLSAAVTENFNIFGAPGGPEAGNLSDTLSIAFMPGVGAEVAVDLHFLSDNGGGIALDPLPSGPNTHTVNELDTLPGYVDVSSTILSDTGQADFHLRFASTDATATGPTVPEPASLAIAGAGVVGLFLLRRRGRI